MAPSHGFAATSHREAALRGAPASHGETAFRGAAGFREDRRHAVHPSRNAVLRLLRDFRRRSFILDELGYLPFAQTGSQLLFHLISPLYERTFRHQHHQLRPLAIGPTKKARFRPGFARARTIDRGDFTATFYCVGRPRPCVNSSPTPCFQPCSVGASVG